MLMGGVSSVGQMVASSDKAGLIGQEEAYKRRNLFRRPAPAHWLKRHHASDGCVFQLLRHEWCVYQTRANDIDTNTHPRILHRGNLRQSDNPVFGCRVCGRSWQSDRTKNRRHVDDSASASIQHGGDLILHAVENAI